MDYEEWLKNRDDINNNILKCFGVDIEKARSGVYQDTSENRRLGRVGLRYGETKSKQDKSGNDIGDGTYHHEYEVYDFKKYPQIESQVSKSLSTESVYVRYENVENNKSVTVRFSDHENNAVKFGDQLDGDRTSENEILFHLGLKKRTFVPIEEKRLKIEYNQPSAKKVAAGKYEYIDKTLNDLYKLGEGADLSKYQGKVTKDGHVVAGDKVRVFIDRSRGRYKYEDL